MKKYCIVLFFSQLQALDLALTKAPAVQIDQTLFSQLPRDIEAIIRFFMVRDKLALLIKKNTPDNQLAHITIEASSEIESLAVSSEGNYALFGTQNSTATLLDLTNKKRPRNLAQFRGKRVALSPDAHYAMAADDSVAALYDLTDKSNPKKMLEFTEKLVACTPNAHLALTALGSEAALYDIRDGKKQLVKLTHLKEIRFLALSSCANYVFIISDDLVNIWNVSNKKEPYIMSIYQSRWREITSVYMTPDARYLFCGYRGSCFNGYDAVDNYYSTELLDLQEKSEAPKLLSVLRGHKHYITGIAVTHDARYAATSSADKTIKIWDLADKNNPQEIVSLTEPLGVKCIALTPDAFFALSSQDKTIKLWHLGNSSNLSILDLMVMTAEKKQI